MTSWVTVEAPANIAFLKYWGAVDLEEARPAAPSLSMTLRTCTSVCTAALQPGGAPDEVRWVTAEGRVVPAPPAFARPILDHIDRLRRRWARREALSVTTRNSFPAAAGMASSASGFAALTLALMHLFDIHEDASDLARLSGSGSAARSVLGGYVLWPEEMAPTGPCRARQLFPPEHWDLTDLIALVDTRPKRVSSREGHRRAPTSPYFAPRLQGLAARLDAMIAALGARDFEALGELLEEEAIDLHVMAMTSRPPIFYWRPETVALHEAVRAMRRRGLAAYFTMDAGANVHVLCRGADEPAVLAALERLPEVLFVQRDGVGCGPRRLDRRCEDLV